METMKMTELTDALNAKGIKAIFSMSGGNCGTIYIGNVDADGNYEFAVGPGNYANDEIHYQEICWGVDGSEDATYYIQHPDDFTPENVAHLIATSYWGSACGACGEWNHGSHQCSEDMFACGSCGDAFEMKDGAVAINHGLTEFTCYGCKVVA